MIEINNRTYSGNIAKNEDNKVIVLLYTNETMQDLMLICTDVSEIKENTFDGAEKTYMVNHAVSITNVAKGVYSIEFSTKEDMMTEMSNAIDELLVMLLENNNV